MSDQLFPTGDEAPGGRTSVPARRGSAARAAAPGDARRGGRAGAPARHAGGADRAAPRDRRGPAALDGPLRPAWQREDDARARRRGDRQRGLRGAQRRRGGPRGGARRASSAPSTVVSPRAPRRRSSSTRSTASTRRSRTRCCPPSRRAWSRSSGRRRRTPTSRSTRPCSRGCGSTSCTRWTRRRRDAAAPRARPGRERRGPSTTRRSRSSPTARGGDARTALGALEIALESADHVTIEVAEEALQRRALRYDKGGDQHYDYISAYIKATRASDPDAALYYLAVMLEGGEDPRFLARRMVILASEDVGGADPTALTVATATADAVEHVGMPECVLRAVAVHDPPRAGAEVQRGDQGDRRRARPRPPLRRPAAAGVPARRALRRRRGARSRPGLRVPARPARGTCRRRTSCPRRSATSASTTRATASRRCAPASTRSAGLAAGTSARCSPGRRGGRPRAARRPEGRRSAAAGRPARPR